MTLKTFPVGQEMDVTYPDFKVSLKIDANEQVQLAFGSLHLGNINVEEADRVAFKTLPLRFVASDVRQAGDAVPLEATMQR